jgi:hypothetical protein
MSELAEAFVYLWYHGPTKRYYLGKHKGTIDDGYSHSSSVMESWDANNPPEGWRRRILAYGSWIEISSLEQKFLMTRKEAGYLGNRYLNLNIGNGAAHVWTEKSRAKMSKSIKTRLQNPLAHRLHKEAAQRCARTPEGRAQRSKQVRDYIQSPHGAEEFSKRLENTIHKPETREKVRITLANKWKDPAFREKNLTAMLSASHTPEAQAKRKTSLKKFYDDPNNKARRSEINRQYYKDNPEACKKISERTKKFWNTSEGKAKKSAASKAAWTEERKKRHSEIIKRRCAEKRMMKQNCNQRIIESPRPK